MAEIPAKPAVRNWTDEQWRAIAGRGGNMLVAAAAGSGKTAVLVERIIRLVTDGAAPVDIDRLLVVTFTQAAASEMRVRIREALEQELIRRPSSLDLRRQLLLLNQASISTIHAFCLEVVRRYAYLLDLDPSFRVADEPEARLLRQEVLEELFEERYRTSPEESPFFALVEWFGSDRDDAGLQELVERLYDFAMSHPWPERWLDEMAAMYRAGEGAELERLPWVRALKEDLEIRLQGVCDLLKAGADLCRHPGGPLPYLENLTREMEAVEEWRRMCRGSWEELYRAFQANPFGRLNACRGDQYDRDLQEKVKELRNKAKAEIDQIRKSLFGREPEAILEELNAMAPIMEALAGLVKDFAARYAALKRDRALADFADLEHYCLKIFLRPDSTPENPLPSEIALQHRERFVEILVDEYQDTNPVQETILSLISREEPGNRFMVGDVKQSIYRFRLTEPKLFLEKYRSFRSEGGAPGTRIDLVRNFRSRQEILAATNFVFRQIMHERAAEIDYDGQAELKWGAEDYPSSQPYPVEVHLIDREEPEVPAGEDSGEAAEGEDGSAEGEAPGGAEAETEELEAAQLEGRLIAARIKELIRGPEGGTPFQVYDRRLKVTRNVQYRDIVVLLRSARNWAPLLLEEFRKQGIPAYGEENEGYFAATEIEVMLSLLRIIDNPYQDIPLAAVLRSPVVGLTADELAEIRICGGKGSFYEALLQMVRSPSSGNEELKRKLEAFLNRLEAWRTEARQGALSSLIWQIYRETGYFDYVGGLPGGGQRQANLRILYERALKFEQTSFRGLFRFLRFVERMRERGEDMGTARTLGEQEDVVRIMTIHKSKGLEFPVVFVAGLGKAFNLKDLRAKCLFHKELGFGSHYVDLNLRASWPSLSHLAVRNRVLAETLAEEMRLLYVAMTRAKEKCILIGTARSLGKLTERWGEVLSLREWRLPTHLLAKGRCFLDWIGLALIRHRQAEPLRARYLHKASVLSGEISQDPSQWEIRLYTPAMLSQGEKGGEEEKREIWEAIRSFREIVLPRSKEEREADLQWIDSRLSWSYPHSLAQSHMAKQSVSELKRKLQLFAGEGEPPSPFQAAPVFPRPRFVEEKGLTAAERGTAMHMVMQQLEIRPPMDEPSVGEQVKGLVERELLTPEEAAAIDVSAIAEFFRTELGRLYFAAERIYREIPFSLAVPAEEAYPGWKEAGGGEETVLVQGIIDCLLETGEGLILVDYKTDWTGGLGDGELRERYRIQLALYARAVERIWNVPLRRKVLYFFDGRRMIEV